MADIAETAPSTAGPRTSAVWSTPSTMTRASRPASSGASSTSSARPRRASGTRPTARAPGRARSRPDRAGPCRRTGSRRPSAAAAPTLLLPDEPGPSSATTSLRACGAVRRHARRGLRGRARDEPAARPRPRTSACLERADTARSRARPGERVPIRTRTSRSTGAPTASNMRRSWRFQPWASVARYQPALGRRAEAGRRGGAPPSRSWPQAAQRREPLLEPDPGLAPRPARCRAGAPDRSRTRARRRTGDAARARPRRHRW